MKLIIPAKFHVEGGIERVILSLLKEFGDLIEGVVILLPKKSIEIFQRELPETSNIVYEWADWPEKTIGANQLRSLGYIRKIAQVTNLNFLGTCAFQKSQDIRSSGRIRFLIKKYQCTHCLYFISNRVPFPQGLDIPVVTLCHDLFWHFAPLTYAPELVQKYDDSLRQWLIAADKVITVSSKTRQDLLTIFPGFDGKVESVPSASELPQSFFADSENALSLLVRQNFEADQALNFFFPSSFSLYKDHLTLMRASIKAFHADSSFKILMTGKDTDRLARGDLDLTKQKSTLEYKDYIEQFQQLYSENKQTWHSIFYGFGYCELAVVEAVYQFCDCVMMPSRYEGFGLAISEAIVRGLPVIAADIEVFHEQVEIYNCADRVRFFEPGSETSLQACLAEFINAPLAKLSESEASNRFGHWTWQQVAENYIRVLSKI